MNYKTLWDSRSDSGLGSGIHGVCFQAEFGMRESDSQPSRSGLLGP